MTKEVLSKGVELNGNINKLKDVIGEINRETITDIKVKLIFDNDYKVDRFTRILPDFITDEVVTSIKEILNNNLEKYKEEFEDLCCCDKSDGSEVIE